jgi:hypothetical protein
MDKTKIIKKVLLENAIAGKVTQEIEGSNTQESLMNWVGGPLPSEYGGTKITNIVKTITVPKPEDLTATPNVTSFCTKLLAQPDNKFQSLDDCIRVQFIATVQQMQAGGLGVLIGMVKILLYVLDEIMKKKCHIFQDITAHYREVIVTRLNGIIC